MSDKHPKLERALGIRDLTMLDTRGINTELGNAQPVSDPPGPLTPTQNKLAGNKPKPTNRD